MGLCTDAMIQAKYYLTFVMTTNQDFDMNTVHDEKT